jgi:phosphate acetyltransferase
MSLIEQFIERAKKAPRRVVLPEGDDERIIKAASKLAAAGIAKPIIIGKDDAVRALAKDTPLDGIRILDPEVATGDVERYAAAYAKARNVKEGMAARLVKRDLLFGAMMVSEGDADAMVAGVTKPTAQVISAAALAVGFAEGITQASSYFLMVLPDGQVLVYADCAVVIAPSPADLAGIGVETARNTARLLGVTPKVAFLGASNRTQEGRGNAARIREAVAAAKKMAPEIAIDGEMDVYTALGGPGGGSLPGSPVAGAANVLVFPHLEGGNIGYKLTQYLAGAKAIGPIMQGFRKPINDLSRGASVDDIVAVCAIASLQCVD